MKKQTTTLAIGSKIVSLIAEACKRCDGGMIRHNGDDYAIIRVTTSGHLITDDGTVLPSTECRIYRTTTPQLRSIATLPVRTVVTYSDATLVIARTGDLWTWRTVVDYRTVAIGYSTHHDNALEAAYAIAIA